MEKEDIYSVPDREESMFAQNILETQIQRRSCLWKYYHCNIAKVMSEGGFGLCRSWHVKYVQEQHTWSTLPLHRLSSFSTPELNAVDTFPSARLRLRPLTSPRLVDPSPTPTLVEPWSSPDPLLALRGTSPQLRIVLVAQRWLNCPAFRKLSIKCNFRKATI